MVDGSLNWSPRLWFCFCLSGLSSLYDEGKEKVRVKSVSWRNEFLRIFTVAFLLFSVLRGALALWADFLTLWGNHLPLSNLT